MGGEMKRILCIAALFALVAGPAVAGQGLMCSGPDEVDVQLPLAGGGGLSALSVEIKVGSRVWAYESEIADATIIRPAQSFLIDDRYYFDFTDPNLEGIVARVRLFRATGLEEPVFGGTLSITDVGAWPISCDVG
jgi:hypothetical protein